MSLTTFELAARQSLDQSSEVRLADGEVGGIEYLGYNPLVHGTIAYLDTRDRRVQLVVQGHRSAAWIHRLAETDLRSTTRVL